MVWGTRRDADRWPLGCCPAPTPCQPVRQLIREPNERRVVEHVDGLALAWVSRVGPDLRDVGECPLCRFDPWVEERPTPRVSPIVVPVVDRAVVLASCRQAQQGATEALGDGDDARGQEVLCVMLPLELRQVMGLSRLSWRLKAEQLYDAVRLMISNTVLSLEEWDRRVKAEVAFFNDPSVETG